MLKKHGEKNINSSIITYTNKIENRITSEIKTGYYLDFLTPETMKLLSSAKSKIKNNENGENVPYLELTEVIVIDCNVIKYIVIVISKVQESYIHVFLINSTVN